MNYKIIEEGRDYTVSIAETDGVILKKFDSEAAHYIFDSKTGRMMLWGKTYEDATRIFPVPNILDIEITTKCDGGCPYCYKTNTSSGKNMSFDTFKRIFKVLPKSITQIAFGADRNLSSNPDLISIMEYTKNNGVIPNITAAYVTDEMADVLSVICGAVAISRHENKDDCYDSIKRLTDRGMDQVSIHLMASEETYDRCLETLMDAATDSRLKKLNAVIFLSLKQKGRGEDFHILSEKKFNNLVSTAIENNIGLGFDSCGSLRVLRALGSGIQNEVMDCGATLDTCYINVDGYFFPCSFCEGSDYWEEGLNVLDCNNSEDFENTIWNNLKTNQFRERLLQTEKDNEFKCRTCPIFNV